MCHRGSVYHLCQYCTGPGVPVNVTAVPGMGLRLLVCPRVIGVVMSPGNARCKQPQHTNLVVPGPQQQMKPGQALTRVSADTAGNRNLYCADGQPRRSGRNAKSRPGLQRSRIWGSRGKYRGDMGEKRQAAESSRYLHM